VLRIVYTLHAQCPPWMLLLHSIAAAAATPTATPVVSIAAATALPTAAPALVEALVHHTAHTSISYTAAHTPLVSMTDVFWKAMR
jgi:hypothetical protein